MRLSSVVMLGLVAVVLTGCDDDDITGTSRPPLAAVRIVNANTEGWAVDIRSITQIQWAPVANNLGYRGTTVYYATEAGKELAFRVFPTSTQAAETSRILLETSFTFQEGQRYTVVLVGSVTGTLQFLIINDDFAPPPADNISIRFVNITTAAANGYITNLAADPQPGAPTWPNVGARTAASYVNRPAGGVAVQATGSGNAAAQGPTAGAVIPGTLPAAGVNSAGTKFSVYYFPAVSAVPSAQGRPAVAGVAATLLWLVDRNPAD